nr:hypothetical protein [Tanacetum cinerariifolium]
MRLQERSCCYDGFLETKHMFIWVKEEGKNVAQEV